MENSIEMAIKRLQELEAQAEDMRDECHKTRMLLEAGVSTQAKKSKPGKSHLAALAAERKKFLNKKTRQVTTTGDSQQ